MQNVRTFDIILDNNSWLSCMRLLGEGKSIRAYIQMNNLVICMFDDEETMSPILPDLIASEELKATTEVLL